MKYTNMSMQTRKGQSNTLQRLDVLLVIVVILGISVSWYISFYYKNALRQAIISSYQETQLEIVRSVARAAELYVEDEIAKGTNITTIEQNIFKRFVVPIHLLKNGDAWIYAPDHVVFDLSSDFPEKYRNKSMAEIFALQVHYGASHYEKMADDVLHAREGRGWYIWLPEKGAEIAAWTPVKFKNYVWVIGVSTPLFEIFEATNVDGQQVFVTRMLVIATVVCCILLIFFLMNKSRSMYLANESYETKIKLESLIEAIPDVIFFKDRKGRNLLVNKAFEERVGMEKRDILGKLDSELFSTEKSQIYQLTDEQVFENRQPCRAEESWLTNTNEPVFYETMKVPLCNDRDELIGLVGISRDITERKRNEETLERKIVSLTRALDDVESITFEELFKIEDIQRLQDEFSEATGVAAIMTKPDGTPITQPSNFCRLCNDVIRKTDKGLRNCCKSDAILGQYNPDGPTVQQCLSGGLWDAGAAISIGDKHIASWLIGQVRDETQGEEQMRAYAQEIGADEVKLLEAFREVPSMSYDKFTRVAQVLYTLAKQLSTTAYQNIQQARFIMERKKIEKSLRTSNKRYQALTELLPIGIFEIDIEGNILFANQAFLHMTQYSRNDLNLDVTLRKIIAFEDYKKVVSMIQHFIKGNSVDGNEYRIRKKDGSLFVVFMSLRQYSIESDLRLIGYIFDLSGIKEKEKALLESEEKLARSKKMESLGLLAGGVAHDLNNILSGVVSYPELLLLDIPETSSLRKPMEVIKQSGEKAVEIVQDLLTLARRSVIVAEIIDLNATIRQQLESPEMIKLLHFHSNVQISTSLDPKLHNIKGSATHVAKSLMNLISNAAEAMPEGGMISITTQNTNIDSPLFGYEEIERGEYAVLTISDTGIGMTKEDTEKIFEPFYTKKKMGKSGTGLGMAVVWGTVKDHNGFIDLKSEEGVGSTFFLYFPTTRDVKQESLSEAFMQHYGNGEKILIVDDVAEQREIATAILKKLRYTVVSVQSGEEALEFLRNEDVDLVMLDMIMDPGIDGVTTYKRIHEFKPHQRAIIASGFSMTKHVDELRQLGINVYVKKPYSIEQISEAIKASLSSKPHYL